MDVPGYDVAALVEKSGKSASHIYARLSLFQLIAPVAEAFVQERITASHANLIVRLPQEHQAAAFENCWRKDWQDKEGTCSQRSIFQLGYRPISTGILPTPHGKDVGRTLTVCLDDDCPVHTKHVQTLATEPNEPQSVMPDVPES